ncbi:hypothetical protein TNIN_370901 [Trichonephila inaurata madagascariensis]|uniref:Uncharacterized protein n=1 Tax=Trichonephila inaurata madagascariensis TaxID=2747483 RepID=A0A8X6K172_9ARAC|nr:hypothetical protein TNIN_370901 [Trichonephila inaurata madagascariensis]
MKGQPSRSPPTRRKLFIIREISKRIEESLQEQFVFSPFRSEINISQRVRFWKTEHAQCKTHLEDMAENELFYHRHKLQIKEYRIQRRKSLPASAHSWARWPKVKVLVAALENPATPEVNHCSASERLKERHLKDDQQSDSSEEDPDPPKICLERPPVHS